MTDWAEIEREKLAALCGCINDSRPILDALRKAYADGMRKTAKRPDISMDTEREIFIEAAAIENGESISE